MAGLEGLDILHDLDLSFNQIRRIKDPGLPFLCTLTLEGNPLPDEILARLDKRGQIKGPQKIRDFLAFCEDFQANG